MHGKKGEKYFGGHMLYSIKRLVPQPLRAVGIIAIVGLTGRASAQSFVGGGNGPTFDTRPAVTVADHSGEAGGRPIVDIIDGAGMLTKLTDSNGSDNGFNGPFGQEGMFRGHTHDNPGTVIGSNWGRFEFEQVYPLKNLWIWNWNDNTNSAGDNTRQGWKHITAQYSVTGGPLASEWTTADLLLGAAGDNLVPQSDGSFGSAPDLIAPFSSSGAPVLAKYVVLTNTGVGPEITWGGDDGAGDAGLSEVRFEVPEPASLALLPLFGLAALRRRG
jgi:hypothetical protein